ncbi:hypothetical protein BDN67DRAFT_1022733, partial [Paxillus ammoniavirescens]
PRSVLETSLLVQSIWIILCNNIFPAGLGTVDFDEMLPSPAGDFFSNDYPSLSTDTVLQEHFLRQALAAPRLLGSSGSRLSTGNSEGCNMLGGSSASLLHHYLHLHSLAILLHCPTER